MASLFGQVIAEEKGGDRGGDKDELVTVVRRSVVRRFGCH
jgi:hypothetical protein